MKKFSQYQPGFLKQNLVQFLEKTSKRVFTSMIIYIYSKCSTCKQAIRFLREHDISATIKEITDTPPSMEELQTMLLHQKGNIKKLFNTSGQLYRSLQLSEKLDNMPQSEALRLLTQNGMLVKRPFLLGKNFGLTGFNEKEWALHIRS